MRKLKTLLFSAILLLFCGNITAQNCDYSDDLQTLPPAPGPNGETSTAGWTCSYYVFSGDQLEIFNRSSTEIGIIQSPVFDDGCKSIHFYYSHGWQFWEFNDGVHFKVELKQDGAVVWSQEVKEDPSLANEGALKEFSSDNLNIKGAYQLVITNLNYSEGPDGWYNFVDIKDICMTANPQPSCDYSADIYSIPETEGEQYYVDTPEGTTPGGWTWACSVHEAGSDAIRLNGGMIPYQQGFIASPVLKGGCKAIRFSYSTTVGTKMRVEIRQNENVVWNKDIVPVQNAGWIDIVEDDLNIEGDFQFIILNMADGAFASYQWLIDIKNICITANIGQAPIAPTVNITGVSKATGNFWDKANVTLRHLRPDVSVYYTTDGEEPTAESTLYTEPFELTSTADLKAIAVANGSRASAVLDTLVTVTTSPYKITAPANATVYVGQKDRNVDVLGNYLTVHYIPFAEKTATYTTTADGKKTWYYNLSGQYNYRVSREGALTHVGLFTPSTTDKALEVTEEQLTSHSPQEIDHDVKNLLGRNVADVYININAQGYLTLPLKSDTTFQLIHTRNWQAIDTDVNNYFIEPDFHYTVLNESGQVDNTVISIDSKGIIKPLRKGTAIVQVTYDAMMCAHTKNVGNNGAAFFGAIWPENTGTFVVSVGDADAPETSIKPNMLVNEYWNSKDNAKEEGIYIDAELDVLYYVDSTGGYEFTFKPENVFAVTLARPTLGANIATYNGFSTEGVTRNADGSFTVKLTFGRNIIKMTSMTGESVYQIITAKPVNYTITNETHPDAEKFQPGDKVSINFATLYHPANKLSGIYNMSAGIQYTGPETEFPLILGPGQYTFASAAQKYTITIPADYSGDEYVLDNGVIRVNGFGSTYGAHRKITKQSGVNPNLSASVQKAFFGSLPEIILNTGVAPTVPTGIQQIPANTDVMVMWTASTDNVAVTGYNIYVDGVLKTTTANTAYVLNGLTAGVDYLIEIEAFDAKGNTSEKASITVALADETAPSVPTNLEGIPAETTIALSWTASTDNVAIAGYNVYVDGEFKGTTTETTYTVENLTASTEYSVAVEAFDAASNKSAKATTSVTTTDETAPGAPTNLEGTPAETTIALSWTASTDNVAVTGYNIYIDDEFAGTTTETTYTIENLTASTEYSVAVEAFDAASNKSAKATTSVTTIDETAPSVPANLAGVPSETTIALSWTASTDNVAVTGYKIYVNGQLKDSTTEAAYTVENLTAATEYSIAVEAFDAAGNQSAKATTSVTTTDETAPSVPANLAGVPSETTIALSWTASTDNVAVTGYNVYVDGEFKGTTTETIYSIDSLTPSTTYSIAVEAFDATGNQSAKTTVSVITSGTVSIAGPLADSEIVVYPNPAQDYLYIKAKEGQMESVSVSDVSGRLIYTNNKGNSELSIPVSSWSNGTYIIAIRVNETVKTYKIVKK